MLSPHEFTTLMIVKNAPDQIEPDREELHTLLERQLVIVELLASGHGRFRITPDGHAVLQAFSRIHWVRSLDHHEMVDETDSTMVGSRLGNSGKRSATADRT
jgi:hypothetical protein